MPSGIDQLLIRKIEHWKRQQPIAAHTAELADLQRPMITISRARGSAGHQLGESVAKRLGFDLYDRQLVEQIALAANVRAQVVETLDAKVQAGLTARIGEHFESGAFTAGDYLAHLAEVTLTLAQHGRGVLLGRGCSFILDPRTTLRVRVVAPLDFRVARIATTHGLAEQEARAEVLRVDAERAAYVRWHFDRDIDETSAYDMILNNEALSIDDCARLVEEAFRLRFGAPEQKASTTARENGSGDAPQTG